VELVELADLAVQVGCGTPLSDDLEGDLTGDEW
jgi:hypothetical protein